MITERPIFLLGVSQAGRMGDPATCLMLEIVGQIPSTFP